MERLFNLPSGAEIKTEKERVLIWARTTESSLAKCTTAGATRLNYSAFCVSISLIAEKRNSVLTRCGGAANCLRKKEAGCGGRYLNSACVACTNARVGLLGCDWLAGTSDGHLATGLLLAG